MSTRKGGGFDPRETRLDINLDPNTMKRMRRDSSELVERGTEDPCVGGSIPSPGTVMATVPCFPWPGSTGRTGVAQSAEPSAHNGEVAGSTPASGTITEAGRMMRLPSLAGLHGERWLSGYNAGLSIRLRGFESRPLRSVRSARLDRQLASGERRGRGEMGSRCVRTAVLGVRLPLAPPAERRVAAAAAARSARGAGVVQTVEQPPRKRQVAGSMPVTGPAVVKWITTTGTTTAGGASLVRTVAPENGARRPTGMRRHGQVPEWSMGPGRNPGSRELNIGGSTPPLPTGTTAGGRYRGRS